MTATRIIPAYYSNLGRLRMLGGDAALDMANTTHWRDGAIIDFINDYESLLNWCVPAKLLTINEAGALLGRSKREISTSVKVLKQWLRIRNRLREHLSLLTAKAEGQIGQASSFEPLAKDIRLIVGKFDVLDVLGEFGKDPKQIALTLPLTRTLSAILNLMLFTPPSLIHLCEGDPCGAYFINHSRSKPRRWCAMDSCGNRAKVHRHRAVNAGSASHP